ncbi:MAG: DUF3800 domain-containing protein [Patescibacteria group bacterium]|jgi:hypothetical protein
MLIFVDESGDTGRKLNKGSSRYFIIAIVIFSESEEALNCDKRINQLRREIGKPDNFEFHFTHNSETVRQKFLQAIQPYHFNYFSVVIDKHPNKLWGPGFKDKESFYKYACNMVFTNALFYLDDATAVLDKSGSPDFRNRLAKYLRKRINEQGTGKIKKLKQQRSSANNLLQLADYVSGIINRKVQNKRGWMQYYKYISDKENWVQIWPK